MKLHPSFSKLKLLLPLFLLFSAGPAQAAPPVSSLTVLPLPGVGVNVLGRLDGWEAFGLSQDFSYHFGYTWDVLNVYRPERERGYIGRYRNSFPEVELGWAVLLLPSLKGKVGWDMQRVELVPMDPANPAPEKLYQKSPSSGSTQTLGAALSLDRRKDAGFPLEGDFLEFWGKLGQSSSGKGADFSAYSLQAEHYFPLGGASTLLCHSLARWACGNIPWTQKFDLGSDRLLRGYDGHRFTGDLSLVFNLEYRRFLLDLPFLFTNLGLGGAGFIDAGRSWESGIGVVFPRDMRANLGGSLLLLLSKNLMGRVDVGLSDEGTYGLLLLGNCF